MRVLDMRESEMTSKRKKTALGSSIIWMWSVKWGEEKKPKT